MRNRQNYLTSETEQDLVPDFSIKLSWNNISYTVKHKISKKQAQKEDLERTVIQKQILKPQSGVVNSGETMFIMGSSGAGKTTLLNALWDRIPKNRTSKLWGKVVINEDYPVTQKDFGKYGAYVMQDDVLFPTLTWEEVIRFSARLKLDIKGEELERKVNGMIDTLGLVKCRNTMIGNYLFKGLSGGERKRTAIAVEMITDPQVLFLDEPTSGLDSFNANKIVRLLVAQSRMKKTIIATIHQPSSNTFALFDKLILLMDGNWIYQGEAKDSVNHFEKLGFKIPQYANPSDYFLKEFSISLTRKEDEK